MTRPDPTQVSPPDHGPRPDFSGTSRFEIRRCLGQGAFGIVYEAWDLERSTAVALKLLHKTEPGALLRFKREFRTLADLTHPNLIALDELFNHDDRWFFTMALVPGQPIVEYVRDGPWSVFSAVEDAADLQTSARIGDDPETVAAVEIPPPLDEARLRQAFAQLADALMAVHRQGIVHRDVKPSNVLVTAEGRTILLDFGIATQISPHEVSGATIVGTPAYMAPEQARRVPLTPAADWYSVGVMLYEALAGHVPFAGTALEMIAAKEALPSPPTGPIGSELAGLTLALLSPDPSSRPAPHEVLRHLRRQTVPSVEIPAADAPLVPALIGRDAQLRALSSAFDSAAAGRSVVMFMPGASGMGKTALLRRFVDDVRRRPEAPLVVASRCHERESVPYKAVDGLIDGLTGYLRRLPPLAAARLLPRDIPLLARLFPVLSRVTEIERAQTRVTVSLEAVELRHRAAAALRELLARLSDRTPVVLAIDDLQWGDLDSWSLLQEILRPPEPPSVLLLLAYRAEDSNATLVRALRSSVLLDASSRDVRTLQVDELTLDQASELVRRELAARSEGAPQRVMDIARESRGNPFFVHELVRHALTVGGPVRLEMVIRERVDHLPANSQHLLTAIALSAEPISLSVAATAAGCDDDAHEALRTLRAQRLVRVHDSPERQTIEPYHDRIRETIVEAIDTSAAPDWHRRLAAAWEASGLATVETLVTHYRGAVDPVRTTEYAVRSAEAADEALAFQRAADYYRLLIEVDGCRRVRWLTRLGDALANAGRGREAAAAYLDALPDASSGDAIDLERRAAEQLIRAGHLDQAEQVLGSLLPRIGVRPARTEAGAFAGLVGRRLALALRGTRFRSRSESEVSPDDLYRIDVLWSIGAPLSLVELARGNHLHLRGTHYALQAGEPRRVVRALSALACASAIAGTRREARTARILAQAKALAAEVDDQTSTARVALAEAMCHKVLGRWGVAREYLERAIELLAACRGVRWEIETARTLLHDTLFWMGEWKLLFDQIPARLQEAEDCGDLYSATHVSVRLSPIAHLAADRPERARADAITGMARWPSGHFDLQHRWEVCSVIEADLYAGRAAAAHEHLRINWPRLKWMLRAFQNARIEMFFLRARISLALVGDGDASALRYASRDAARLEHEGAPWANALALLLRASIAATADDRQGASALLRSATHALSEAGMKHYAAAAQYRLGQLLGDPDGSAKLTEAETYFKHQTIVNVQRIVTLLAPGKWGTGAPGTGRAEQVGEKSINR